MVFGDLDETAGRVVAAELAAQGGQEPPRVHFQRTDVTSYESLLALFHFAWERFGRVDHAMPFAGIVEIGNWFDPSEDLSSVQKARR